MNIICFSFISENNNNRKIQKNKPKISIFLPIFNKEKYLLNSIQSIQSQTLKEIEIVAVNDCSQDNSLNILNELTKNDTRIKIINNEENRGLLYSRAMGILNSEGEYLLNLDPDDEFEGNDNLEYLYKSTKNEQIDVIIFNTFFKSINRTNLKCSNFHHIQHQPEIFLKAFNDSYRLDDYLIWNKLIRRDLYMKAYEIFKDKIYGKKWNFHEDNIWSILVHRYATSLRCVKKIAYIYNQYSDSLMKNRFNQIDFNSLIYRHEMYMRLFNPITEEKYIMTEILLLFYYIIKVKELVKLIKEKEKNRKKIVDILEYYLNANVGSELNQNLINKFLENIKTKKE